MNEAVMLPTSGALTFLFTDIEGSTRKAHELGEDWFGVLETHHALLRPVFAAHGGLEVSTAGDSFFVVFESAANAVAASVAMQRVIASHDWSPHPQVKVRMGMHTGPARFRPHDNDYAGLTVHAASRVESAAAGAQVLLTQATLDAAAEAWPEDVDVVDLGLHRLKDLPSELQLYQVTAAGLEREFPPVRGVDVVRNNVPVPASTFVGRTEVLARLHRMLDEGRLVSIVGPGGTGKTRVSLRLANERLHRHPDGVWFVELVDAQDHAGVVNAVASALGVREDGERDLLTAVVEHVRTRNVLLVIDNCEHVIDPAASVIDALLVSGSGVRVVATSREPLEIEGERVWPLAPLAIDGDGGEALLLLTDRVGNVVPDFRLDETTVEHALTIVRRLDGLPLALELAAASASMLTLEEIARQLDDRFSMLTRGKRTADERQKTLWGAIDWSYGLLRDDEKVLFRRLAVFPADFDFGVAEAICGGDDLVVDDLLFSLQHKSLVTESASTRLRYLESIREYARDQLAASGEAEALAERHARYFVESISETEETPTEWLDAIHEDLSAALRWGGQHDTEVQLRALIELQDFWTRKGRYSEGRATTDEVVSALTDEQIGRRWASLGKGARLALSQGDNAGARAYFARVARLAERFGTAEEVEMVLGDLGQIALREGDVETAEQLFGRAVDAARRAGDDRKLALTLTHLANLVTQQGDLGRARALALEALELARLVKWDDLDLALTNLLGVIARERGDRVEARQILSDGIALATKLGSDDATIFLQYCLASVELDDGNADAARPHLREALTLGQQAGARLDLAESLEAAARIIVSDDPGAAASLLATADAVREDANYARKPIDLPTYEALKRRLANNDAEPLELEGAVDLALSLLST